MTQQTVRKPIPRGLITDTQRDLIIKRALAVGKNKQLITTDRWDLSKVFYDTRKILNQTGYDTSPINKSDKRKEIHNKVKDICDKLVWEDHLGVKHVGIHRHQIGIFAADRAQMAFNGETYNVTYETFRWLATLGTDIIFTEKEGLVNTLLPFTTNVGIALVQSGGWSSEYTVFLLETAHKLGFKNIAILTDFDSQGVGIAMKFPYVVRLGVDLETVFDLGVNLADVEEHIEPLKWNEKTKRMEENTHWVGLRDKFKEIRDSLQIDPIELSILEHSYDSFLANNLTYLRTGRVELGAITAAVEPKIFWDWLKDRMLVNFPKRDYNRVIPVPEIVYPKEYDAAIAKIDSKIKSVLINSHQTWKDKLEDYDGFVDNTKDKLGEIEKDMRDNTLILDPDVKKLIKDLKKITKAVYLN